MQASLPILISSDTVHMHGPYIAVPAWRRRGSLDACMPAWLVHIASSVPAAWVSRAAAFMVWEIGIGRQWKGMEDAGSTLCGGSGGALLRLLAEEEHEPPQLGCSRGIRLAGSDAPLQQASPPRAEPLGC